MDTLGVACEGDGWEEERSGDGRTFTGSDGCSEIFDERMEEAAENRGGVTTGAVVSAGKSLVFGVASVLEEGLAPRCIPDDPSGCLVMGPLFDVNSLSELITGRSRG